MNSYPPSNAKLKALMTEAPMSAEMHAEILRKRVAARRLTEDRNEVALLERADTICREGEHGTGLSRP